MSWDYMGKIHSITRSLIGDCFLVTFSTPMNLGDIAGHSQELMDISIKKHRKKRSLNANAYAWLMITKIADRLHESKEKVYQDMLRDYGQSAGYISVESGKDISKIIKYYDVAGEGTVQGKKFTHYKCYVGSSQYDTHEMSIFIDGIVQEAKQLGIETMSQEDIESMVNLWQEQNL